MLTGQNDGGGRAVVMWKLAPMCSITTVMGHIWKEKQKHGVTTAWGSRQQAALSGTHLDCGNESVLSFNSSSETSVSRISGLDLLPYLRHRKSQKTDYRGST